MSNAATKMTPRGWKLLFDNTGAFTLQKAPSFGGSYVAVTFPTVISREDARELALALLQFTN